MTEQALKRIEEKHHTVVDADGETCAVCPWEHPPPCDVVKLARALDELSDVAEEGWASVRRRIAQKAKRTLEEVGRD